MKFISLFAGIGGFDLGFERAGMSCVAQVENNQTAIAVLNHHYPDIARFDDVRNVGRHNLPSADLICGGFPCQDVSNAGRRAGLAGERSGLWFEFLRIVCETRPRWIVVENVRGLFSSNGGRDFGTILRGLAVNGYDAEWAVLPAAVFGAPHIRERVFIVAYPSSNRFAAPQIFKGSDIQSFAQETAQRWGSRYSHCDDGSVRRLPDFEFLRVDDGIPDPLDRGRYSYAGNAIVPAIAEWIGRRILSVGL